MGLAPRLVLAAAPYLALAAIVVLISAAVTPGESAAQADGPVVRITLNDLPPYVFTPGSPPVQVSGVAPFVVHITWTVDAGPSGEPVEAVRWGWNVRNPQNDEEWEQSWCTTCPSLPVRVVHSGTQRILFEARDRSGATILAQLEIVTIPLAIEATTWGDVKARYAR